MQEDCKLNLAIKLQFCLGSLSSSNDVTSSILTSITGKCRNLNKGNGFFIVLYRIDN